MFLLLLTDLFCLCLFRCEAGGQWLVVSGHMHTRTPSTCTRTYARTQALTHARTHSRTHTRMYTRAHMYMRSQTHARTHVRYTSSHVYLLSVIVCITRTHVRYTSSHVYLLSVIVCIAHSYFPILNFLHNLTCVRRFDTETEELRKFIQSTIEKEKDKHLNMVADEMKVRVCLFVYLLLFFVCCHNDLFLAFVSCVFVCVYCVHFFNIVFRVLIVLYYVGGAKLVGCEISFFFFLLFIKT